MENNEFNTWELQTVARTLWQEIRGGNDQAVKAVAHVILNRLKAGKWGNSLGSVCLWRMQFSGWMDTDVNFQKSCSLIDTDPILQKMVTLFQQAQTEPDFTNGATFYYSTSMKTAPTWVMHMTFLGEWGGQRFYKPE